MDIDEVEEYDHELNTRCYMCQMANGDNEIVTKCHDYIKDSMSSVHIGEMVNQVHEVLSGLEDCSMTKADIKNHICQHMRSQKIVLHHTLKDLTHLAHVTKKCCILPPNPEAEKPTSVNSERVDLRMLSAYLKVIDQVVSVYRMNCMQD